MQDFAFPACGTGKPVPYKTPEGLTSRADTQVGPYKAGWVVL